MHFLWLLWQLAIVVAWSALLIAGVIAIWYGFSFLVLALVGQMFKLRGRTPKD